MAVEMLTEEEIAALHDQLNGELLRGEPRIWCQRADLVRCLATLATLETLMVQVAALTREVEQTDRERVAALAERDEARREACLCFGSLIEADCDTEDWDKVVNNSDNPKWLRPNEAFYQRHPWAPRRSDG